jgi:HSP20 family protein
MDLIGWRNGVADPFQEFEGLQDEINRLFDLTRIPEPRGIFERSYSPAVDVAEDADRFEVLCDLPGTDIKDVEISVAGSVLTIKGERKPGREDGKTYREELRAGRFQRTIQLPMAVDPDKVEAVLKDGVLAVTLPKHEALKPRQISITAR